MIYRTLLPLVVSFVLLPHAPPEQALDRLTPTVHPALPGSVEELWFVPSAQEQAALRTAGGRQLFDAVGQIGAGDHARALMVLNRPALAAGPLGEYALYYRALAQLRLSQTREALATFKSLRERRPQGHLSPAAAIGEAEAAQGLGDFAAAAAIYKALVADKTAVTGDLLLRLGRAALGAGDRERAAEAFTRAYYEYPLTDAAAAASSHLKTLSDVARPAAAASELARAHALFGARRYADARSAYLAAAASGAARELAEMRIAACDLFLKRHQAALDGLNRFLNHGPLAAEARFYHLSALRDLGRHDEFVAGTRALVRDFPDSGWSEEALNTLGTHHILSDRDDLASAVFGELYAKFPRGARAERAAWKYGWWAYKNGDYAEAVRVFESASANFPRSDYRPSFLYWAGRSHGKLGAGTQAQSRLRLVFADYGSSYYGRLAFEQLPRDARAAALAMPAARQAPIDHPIPATVGVIRSLLANGLFDEAIDELRFAQRAWGTSSAIEATIAWAYNQKGELRRGITLMRRAYPQHLTAGGEALPPEILQVIYPLTYWDGIRRHAAAHDLDPFLIAALIAQESTFDPKIRSVANAWGLMQIIPATGRRLAPSLGIRRFAVPMLTDPDTNLRMGTLYFARLVRQFGGLHYALASYNAGESRVVRWKAERPGIDQDEFIDDIPFPETQNYVKRILGTAEEYRRLYAKGGGGQPIPVRPSSTRSGG